MMDANEILNTKLSPEERGAVRAAIRGMVDAAYARGAAQHGLAAWVKGALKSWTVWLGGLLIALPELWPMLEPYVRELLPPESYRRLVQLGGVAVILIRARTSQSLPAKAGAARPPSTTEEKP